MSKIQNSKRTIAIIKLHWWIAILRKVVIVRTDVFYKVI